MKKVICLSLALFLLIMLTACQPTAATTCPRCGTGLPHEASFCSHCGASLDNHNPSLPAGQTPTSENTPPTTENPHEGQALCANCSEVWIPQNDKYCYDCKCGISWCKNAKSGNSKRYCSEHICQNSGCINPREDGSLFCSNHNCDASNCKEAQYNSRYCMQHKCNKCNNKVEDGSHFCKNHNCYGSNCKAETYQNSGFCIEHKCNHPGCTNQKEFNSSYTVNYCFNHNCKQCMRDRVEGSAYCIKCKCSINGCNEFGSYTIGGIKYCNNHRP